MALRHVDHDSDIGIGSDSFEEWRQVGMHLRGDRIATAGTVQQDPSDAAVDRQGDSVHTGEATDRERPPKARVLVTVRSPGGDTVRITRV